MSKVFLSGLFFILNLKVLIFFKSNTQKLLNIIRNISWKFEVASLQNLGGDIFLLIFEHLEKIEGRKIAVHMFV